MAAVAVVLFFSGFVIAMVTEGKACEQKLSEKQATIDQQKTTISEDQEALRQARFAADVLQADRHLHLAVMALEQRNFGTADEQVKKAAGVLSKVEKTGDSEAVAQVASDVEKWMPEVAPDIGSQRTRLLEFSQRLGAALQSE